jgi:hypothetical protein
MRRWGSVTMGSVMGRKNVDERLAGGGALMGVSGWGGRQGSPCVLQYHQKRKDARSVGYVTVTFFASERASRSASVGTIPERAPVASDLPLVQNGIDAKK